MAQVADLTLHQLVENAKIDDSCTQGHDWQSTGGRACPRKEDCGASQVAYQCARCGEYDYGYPGGPGHADCYADGPCRT